MPAYDQFTKMSILRADAVKSGQISGTWTTGGNGLAKGPGEIRRALSTAD